MKKISLLIIVLSGMLLTQSFNIPQMGFIKGLSAKFWPSVILLITCFLGIILWFSSKSENLVIQVENTTKANPFFKNRVLLSIILFFFYIIGLKICGYIVSTILFQIIFLYILNYRNWHKVIAISGISTFLFFFLFHNLLGALLPCGIGFFRELTMLLY